MPQPQTLGIAKSEPLASGTTPPLGIAKSEPLPAATAPPPDLRIMGMSLRDGTWSPWTAVKDAGRTLLGANDLGMAESTPNQKLISGENAAGAVGASLAAAGVMAAAPEVAGVAGLVGVARAVPWAWRAAAGAASVAGAGAGGGAAAVAEGKPWVAPERTPADLVAGPNPADQGSVARSAGWQAAIQAAGLPVGWLANAAGRRLLASPVAKQALTWLQNSRAKHVEEAQWLMTQAQDAIDAHAARRAATRAGEVAQSQILARQAEGTAAQGATRTAGIKAQWPQGEGAPPIPMPMPAHVPGATASATTPPPLVAAHTPSYAATPEGIAASKAELEASGLTPGLAGREPRFGRTPQPRAAEPSTPLGEIPPGVGGTTTAIPARPAGPWDANSAATPPPAAATRIPMPGRASSAAAPPPMAPTAPMPSHTVGTGQPSYAAQASQQAEQVISGAASTSKSQIGAAVEQAAESGPAVPWSPIRDRLNAMYAKTQPEALGGAGGGGAIPSDIAGYLSNQTPEQIRAFMAKAGIQLEEAHPLPGVLGQLQSVEGNTVTFADAHKFKRLLDDAIGWKPAGSTIAPARGQLKQITKGIRGQIREEMAGHAPYDQATAAYKAVSTLFAPGGLARKIQRTAEVDPEALVNTLVSPKKPGQYRMLKEVLTTHAEQGGDAAAGQNAWAAIQSTVMYKHLIQPGIDKWDTSLAKLHPEFLQTLTGEPHAKAVFDRLSSIAAAVKASEARTATELGAVEAQQAALTAGSATRKAQAGVEGVQLRRGQREAGRAVTEAKRSPLTPRPGEDQIGRMLTEQEKAFGQSSLGKPASTTAQLSDLAYAATAPPGSPRQVAGAVRLLWRGPKANDLIHWASLSDANTQMLVHAVSGPDSALRVSNLIRGVEELYRQHQGGAGPQMAVSHQQGSATAPPPGPRR